MRALAMLVNESTRIHGNERTDLETWTERAACRAESHAEFFPEPHTPLAAIEAAYAICRRCPVINECTRAAQDRDEKDGIWGGKNRAPSIENTIRARQRKREQVARERRAERFTWLQERYAEQREQLDQIVKEAMA